MCTFWGVALTQDDSVMDSKLFRFVVGPNERVFTVHSGALLPLGRYFQALIGGEMKESHEGQVEWDDIDEDTFMAFSQYAYMSDYSTPDTASSSSESEESRDVDDDEDFAIQICREMFASSKIFRGSLRMWYKSITEQRRGETKKQLATVTHPILTEFNLTGYSISSLMVPLDDGPEALLPNAKVYVLSDRYDLPQLKGMALGKIYYTLSNMVLTFRSANYVAALVRYVYANTVTVDNDFNQDALRQLVVSFAACVYEHFLINPRFAAAVRDHGEFGLGILALLRHRSP